MSFDFHNIQGPEDSKQANFSSLCSRLILAITPDARPVDGSGGDDGVDTYEGTFNDRCRIFQHKFFLNRLGRTQRRQVERSLGEAVRRHDVAAWVLMLPIDLTPAEIRWFQSLREQFSGIQLDWWGKTTLQQLLSEHPEIALDFVPRSSVALVIVQNNLDISRCSVEKLALALSGGLTTGVRFQPGEDVLSAMAEDLIRKSRLKVLLWGPGPSGGALYEKRCQIRDRLVSLGHRADFSEDVWTPERRRVGGLNLKVAEFLQAKAYDYVICLMTSPGSIGEVHDFANKQLIASKMMICVDRAERGGYSAAGALRVFEGYNGRLHWFDAPSDLDVCHLSTAVVDQVEKVAEGRQFLMANGLQEGAQ